MQLTFCLFHLTLVSDELEAKAYKDYYNIESVLCSRPSLCYQAS